MLDIHPDARQRFEQLGAELLRYVVKFRATESTPTNTQFQPDTAKGPSLTEKDIIGDPVLHYADRDGRQTGKVIVRADGERVGFMGPGYEKLNALARGMAKARPFVSGATQEFLTEQIFAWAVHHPGQQSGFGLVDSVVTALEASAVEIDVIIPISDVHIQSEL